MNRLSSERLDVLLEGARDVHVLVVGDLMLDIYLRGAASRISPEAPVPVVRVDEEWRALGGAGNVAANVVALGASCSIIGCVGTDRAADELRRELAAAAISDAGIVATPAKPTTVKTRIMARRQQVARYDLEDEGDVDAESARALSEAVRAAASAADAIILEDYNKGVLVPDVIATALDAGKRLGRPVVVDPKDRFFFDFGGATVFKPNLTELAAALREPVRADDPEWLERVRRRLACEHLLLTMGEQGMALMTADGQYVRVPTVARSVYDVSGAGDTVTAVIAVALAAGATPVEAAVMANHAAGVEVSKAGVATVSPAELRTAFARPPDPAHAHADPIVDTL
jgi:D-beta-D-heptose 7-phosphate kinase/D-beta-D-heptose 1-phosphate adenosyltransferase